MTGGFIGNLSLRLYQKAAFAAFFICGDNHALRPILNVATIEQRLSGRL
jgi:hypothetical protein